MRWGWGVNRKEFEQKHGKVDRFNISDCRLFDGDTEIDLSVILVDEENGCYIHLVKEGKGFKLNSVGLKPLEQTVQATSKLRVIEQGVHT